MSLTPGTRLGPYEIQSALGAGGMGEVYRARDSRLARDVAIKVLPAGITDPERLARFEQEARAAAALNHPNILAVFDIGSHAAAHDAAPYIVMELLAGETLRERLEAGPVPVRKAIDYAVQIAHGLAAAHEKGIVHRDLKPENVFVTSDERVKILDFGLAKLIQAEPALTSRSMMATGMRHTMPGTLMGTVAYMSPEQVRGAPADHRSDLFALGALLYEIVTGRVAFQRETAAETMTAILRDEPGDLATLGTSGLERLIRRCLEKNPSARFQSALDFGFALESLATASDSGTVGSPPRTSHTRERIAWGVAALSIMAAATIAVWTYSRSSAEGRPAMSFNLLPPAGWHIDPMGQTSQLVAMSPDGQTLAFTARDDQGRSQLWLRPLGSLEARPIAGTEGGRAPFWSPDGRWIAFFADDKLKKIEIPGGIPIVLGDAPTGTSAAWSAGDVILFAQLSPFSQGGTAPGAPGLWRISAAGGAPAAITMVGPGERGHSRPLFLPDGRHFLYSAGNATPAPEASRTVYLAELDRPERTKLFTTDSLVVDYASGHLLFLRGTTLVAQPFDAERLVLSGEPVPVAEDIGAGATGGGNRFGVFSASGDVLAFQTSADVAVHQLAWFDRSGSQISLVGERGSYQSLEILPGDLRAGMGVVDPMRRTRDIWTFDLARNVRTRFTFDPTEERSAIGSPDGRFIVFNSNRSGALEMYRKSASGGGADELLFEDGRSKDPMDWSPDGRYVVYRVTGQASSNDIMALPVAGDGKPFPLVATPFDENYGRLSPDGRWLAYTSDESGQFEVYVTSFPSASGKWQVSTDGGGFPRWRGDGRELYYLAPGNILTAVGVATSAAAVTVEQPRPLFKTNPPNQPGYPYAVTRDGQRFLVNTNLAPPNPLTVIVNWTAALR